MSDDRPAGISIRGGDPSEFVGVMRVLEGALLDVSADRVRSALAGGEALVAVADRSTADSDPSTDSNGPLVGALVRDGERVVAVAVRRSRRGRGIGAALIDAAAAETGRLTARFDPSVRPFYESLGFDVRPVADGNRLRGVRER